MVQTWCLVVSRPAQNPTRACAASGGGGAVARTAPNREITRSQRRTAVVETGACACAGYSRSYTFTCDRIFSS